MTPLTTEHYEGEELDLFRNAIHWKTYWSSHVAPCLSGKVLEVGAGIGGTTRVLLDQVHAEEWVALEPDASLSSRIHDEISTCANRSIVNVQTGILDQHLTEWKERYNAAIYIDVIEHIEQDGEELERAKKVLKPGGKIVVVVPAHQFLYTPFDKSIGHFRRYSKPMLRKVLPAGMILETLWYLDSVGLLASIANKLFLKQSMPTDKQIRFWDSRLVPLSRFMDPLTLHLLGKSLLMVARKSRHSV